MGENRESGFINSEPCIAEFMPNVPHINDPLVGSSINSEADIGNYFHNYNSNSDSPVRDNLSALGGGSDGFPEGRDPTLNSKFPDYAWMKDKKPVRKGEQPQTVPDLGELKHFPFHTGCGVLTLTSPRHRAMDRLRHQDTQWTDWLHT